jgi:hypothetical protein
LAIRTTPSPRVRNAPADPEHAPHNGGLLRPSFLLWRSVPPARSPEPLPEPPSAQSPFARVRRYLPRRSLIDSLGRRYPAVLATTSSCASRWSSGRLGLEALCVRSVQVAVSPCWTNDLPDVIPVNLSPDAGTSTPVVPEVLLLVSSLRASAFPLLLTGRRSTTSVQRLPYGWHFGAAVIRYASGLWVCSPPRSLPPLRPQTQGSRGFDARAHLASQPGPSLLTVRIEQLTVWGLSPHQVHSLVGYSSNMATFG